MFGAALLSLVPSLLVWAATGFQNDLNDKLAIGVTVSLVLLALFARWAPRGAAIAGIVVFLAATAVRLLGLEFTVEGQAVALRFSVQPISLIMNVGVLLLLLMALKYANAGSAAGAVLGDLAPDASTTPAKK